MSNFDSDPLTCDTTLFPAEKMQTLGPSLFHKSSNPSKNLQTVFLSAKVLHFARMRQKFSFLAYFLGTFRLH